MNLTDAVWMAVILAGAVYLLYRSVWKKKGHCQGCDSGICNKKRGEEQPRSSQEL
ncbi:MAG: FeoB-associated Cys-rich membrane protein [Nitrospirota bacterium]